MKIYRGKIILKRLKKNSQNISSLYRAKSYPYEKSLKTICKHYFEKYSHNKIKTITLKTETSVTYRI